MRRAGVGTQRASPHLTHAQRRPSEGSTALITDILVEHPWLTSAGLAVLLVAGPVVGALLASRRRLAWVLAAASTVPVALLTLVPVDRELVTRCTVQWQLPGPGRVEILANVVLFVAPALLAGVASRRPLLVLLALSGLSVAVEALQALAPALGRSCDTSDWLSNTIGAALGAGLAAAALHLARLRGRPGRSSPAG